MWDSAGTCCCLIESHVFWRSFVVFLLQRAALDHELSNNSLSAKGQYIPLISHLQLNSQLNSAF